MSKQIKDVVGCSDLIPGLFNTILNTVNGIQCRDDNESKSHTLSVDLPLQKRLPSSARSGLPGFLAFDVLTNTSQSRD